MIAARTFAMATCAIVAGGGIAACAADAWILTLGRSMGDTSAAIDAAAAWRPPRGGTITLSGGDAVARVGPPGRAWVPLAAIPMVVQDAFTAAEDKSFWSNDGIDPAAIARAAVRNATQRGRRPAGASTITQQFAKLALMDGDSSTPQRKGAQVVLALRIAAHLPKQTIMEAYLNRVYLGRSWTGVGEAARGYFGIAPSDLTLDQAATLAGLARNPSADDPIAHPDQAARRRNQVLAAMVRNGTATAAAAATVIATPVEATAHPRTWDPLASDPPIGVGWATDMARAEMATSGRTPDRGQTVELTVSAGLQEQTSLALQLGLMKWDAHRRGWRGRIGRVGPRADRITATSQDAACDGGCPPWAAPATVKASSPAGIELEDARGRWRALPRGFDWIAGTAAASAARLKAGDVVMAGRPFRGRDGGAIAQGTALQGSAIVLSAVDGEILALAGGFDWTPGGLDRALVSARPPGSTFKPFIYLAALDMGYTPDTTVFDLPISIPDGIRPWSPSDDDGLWEGPIPMSRALTESRNAPAVRMMWTLGAETVSQVAEAFGIYPKVASPATALGAQEATNARMTAAYAALAAHGTKTAIHVLRGGAPADRVQVADAATADALASMMRGVLEDGGTAGALASFAASMAARGHIVAGKTGTSQDFKDAWMIGFAGGIAVGVHVGYDKPQPLGKDAYGAAVAGPIFARVMEAAEREGLMQETEGHSK